jgi:hypothetical protein
MRTTRRRAAIRGCIRAAKPQTGRIAGLPARQARWTRLGATMGYTNTAAKRAAIHAAVESMDWVDADRLADVLGTAPIRFVVAGLFYGRTWQLCSAASTALPTSGELTAVGRDGACRLIGLQSVTGDRYLLLDLGYEAIDLLHQTTVREPE